MGWDVSTGHIDQAFFPCNIGIDLCEYTGVNQYTISLNGHTSPLVDRGSYWSLRDDPGWRVDFVAGQNAWEVSAPDGMRYYFGWGNSATQSTWTVPVNDLTQLKLGVPWRWNLSHVRDRSDNMTAYYYHPEMNNYRSSQHVTEPYVRGGYVERIEYGRVWNDGEFPDRETARLTFEVGGRCTDIWGQSPLASTCPDWDDATAESFPDVPLDLLCVAGPCGLGQRMPAFFTTQVLASVVSSTVHDGVWNNGDRLTFDYRFPPAGGQDPHLWLASVQQTGHGDAAPVTLPAETFGGSGGLLDNRADGLSSWMRRVTSVTLPTGGSIQVTYGQPHPCPVVPPAGGASDNKTDCFPAWGDAGSGAGWVWFNKYVVTKVAEVPNVGDSAKPGTRVTLYEYGYGTGHTDPADPLTQPRWNHDDDASHAHHSYNVWRGYALVRPTGLTARRMST
jgi:hypothetical protein